MSPDTTSPADPVYGDGYEALVNNSAGFGQGVSGGQGGQICRVTSLADSGPGTLRDCATKGNCWVVFDVSGTITLDSVITIADNTTIDGREAEITITGKGLSTARRENIIIHNLAIETVNDDGISVYEAQNIWINHVTVGGASDGALDITDQSQNVTVSWCRFKTQNKTMLIGNSNTKTDDVVINVTLHHNFFDRTIRRSPFARFGSVHMFNNVLSDWGTDSNGGDAVNATFGAKILLENNVFEAGHNKMAVRDAIPIWAEVPGYIKARGNLALNEADVFSSQPEQVFEASDLYDFRLDLADETLMQLVKAYSGRQPASFFESSAFAAEAGARGSGASMPDPDPVPTPGPDTGYRFAVGASGQQTIREVWPTVTLVGFDEADVISQTIVKGENTVIMDLRNLDGPRLTFKGKDADLAWIDHVVYE
ncbi:MAG: polysaccharide lyase family 1 protein [Pseudomonadota bacterium]